LYLDSYIFNVKLVLLPQGKNNVHLGLRMVSSVKWCHVVW